MSFWKYIGEFAFFNMIWNWFAGKPKQHTYTSNFHRDLISDEIDEDLFSRSNPSRRDYSHQGSLYDDYDPADYDPYDHDPADYDSYDYGSGDYDSYDYGSGDFEDRYDSYDDDPDDW